MTMLRCFALLACLCVPVLADGAQEKTKAASPAIAEFIDYATVRSEAGDTLEHRVLRWAKEGATAAEMGARVARDYDLPLAPAQELVDFSLRYAVARLDDDAEDEMRRIEARRIALVDEHPGVWIVFEEAARDVAYWDDCDCARIDALVAKWPDPDAARLRLAPVVDCMQLLSPRTSVAGAGSEPFVTFAREVDGWTGGPLVLAALRVAVVTMEADPAIPATDLGAMHASRVRREIAEFRVSAAVAALPREGTPVFDAFLAGLSGSDRLDIAAAAMAVGNADLARRWRDLARAPSPLGAVRDEDLGSTTGDKEAFYARERALHATGMRQREELLAWALGERSGDPFALLTDTGGRHDSPFQSDPWRAVAAAVAVREGYPMLAEAGWLPDADDREREREKAVAQCYRCAPALLAAIEVAVAERVVPDPAAPAIAAAADRDDRPADVLARIERAIADAPLAWQEQALPPDLRTPRATTEDPRTCGYCGPPPPGKAKPPAWRKRLPRGELVRWERDGDRIVAITASQTLDPVGELSSGGYWVSVSTDRGKTFAPPLYTGLRVYAPYVVRPESKLALMDGDTLQLEVAVRELDAERVMFPPIRLPLKREADDLFVRLPLADLQRDSDDDGLPDPIEAAMLLDPLAADTDGDGLRDGADMLPNVPWRAAGNDDRAAALAVALDEIFDRELGAILTTSAHAPGLDPAASGPVGSGSTASNDRGVIFLQAPSDALARMQLRKPVVVLSDAQVGRLQKVRGAFYPFRIYGLALNRAGDEGVVTWTAGWTGGAFRLHKRDGKWSAETTSSWITSLPAGLPAFDARGQDLAVR